jgi:hypothetical protein
MTTIVFEPLCDNHSAYPTKPRPQLGMGYCLDDHYVKTIVWRTCCDIHWVKSEFLIDDVHNAYPTKPRPQRSEPLAICVLKYGVALLQLTRPKRKAV